MQGITGSFGARHAQLSLEYGTKLVAGVTPGKGGQDVEGIPVFDTVADAVRETGANTSMVFVPARFAADAIYEAVDAGIATVVCIAEGLPAAMIEQAAIIRATRMRPGTTPAMNIPPATMRKMASMRAAQGDGVATGGSWKTVAIRAGSGRRRYPFRRGAVAANSPFNPLPHPPPTVPPLAELGKGCRALCSESLETRGTSLMVYLGQGEAAGVEATPTLFFNDRKYEGPLHPKYITMWIDEELAVNR